MPLRVFVSHSAKEEQAKKVQEKVVDRLRAQPKTFTPLMDQSNLETGDRWRARINLWIGACDVAVVLLSTSALESAYVAYEVSVLSYRAGMANSTFRIIPVYLENVDAKRLRASRLDPAQLQEIQKLAGKTTPDEIADAVIEELAALAEQAQRPIDELAQRVKSLLFGVDPNAITAAAGKLPGYEIPWEPGDLVKPFAERLLGAGMLDAIAALIALRNGMDDKQKQDKLPKLVDLIACTWVDIQAVGTLEGAQSAALRAVALNAVKTDTARLYRIAASRGSDTWIFVPCDNVVAGEQKETTESGETKDVTVADQLIAKVAAALRAKMKYKPSIDLKQKLQVLSVGHIVLVAMPGEGVVEDPEVALALRNEFPTVTFFFLTGDLAAEVSDGSARLIIPQLYEDDEDRFLENYDTLDSNVMDVVRAGG